MLSLYSLHPPPKLVSTPPPEHVCLPHTEPVEVKATKCIYKLYPAPSTNAQGAKKTNEAKL